MKPLRRVDVKKAVGVAGQVLSAVLDTRRKPITTDMLNSAGSVSAEWYIETLWHYLAKRRLLQGVSFEVEFRKPAKLTDRQLHFALPHLAEGQLVMDFHVLRRGDAGARTRVPVALVRINHGNRRRRHGVAPEPPRHPYGIEIRRRNLNSAKQVSWYTLVSVIMDVARRGLQILDLDTEPDADRLYVVPRFTFVPLGRAEAQENLFVYPEFAVELPWTPGKSSAAALVTYWAVANEDPWPIAECVVTVVRTTMVDGARRPVDETGALAVKTSTR